jgi:hypothetical protein
MIHDLAINYDGYNSKRGLKHLIDEFKELAEFTLNEVNE